MNTKAWISAFRLRTLPLALSSVITGSFLSAYWGKFNWAICVLTALTTLLLQILSNLANDYGDGKAGTDNQNRLGPTRAIQSGVISLKKMLIAIVIFIVLTLTSGITLIMISLNLNDAQPILFLLLGVGAIIAALKYTAGKNPYGYRGLGDIFVFIFFGWVGVLGTFYLQTHRLEWEVWLPATAIGLLSTGVLNLNNLRDIENDKACGKNTLIVKWGIEKGKIYHWGLILGASISLLIFTLILFHSYFQWLFLIGSFSTILSAVKVSLNKDSKGFDPHLKILALGTFFTSILFGIGLLL